MSAECLRGLTYRALGSRNLVRVRRPFPLIGHIAFGVLERGTNVVQVRPSTLCFHDCIFCSVDAGPSSTHRASEFLVDDVEWLAEVANEVAKIKGGAEALIDGVGEPLSNPRIVELVKLLSDSDYVERIAIETHGGSLSLPLLKRLAEAGLDRVNLSLDTLDPAKAKVLVNSPWYDVSKIVNVVERAFKETSLDFVLTPVVVPGYNEDDMIKLINWAKSLGLGSKIGWPSGVLIQKYEAHKYGRKVKGVRPWSWERFYDYLKALERATDYRLILKPEEIGIRRAPRVARPYSVGQILIATVAGPGWLKGEQIGLDGACLRVLTIIRARRWSPGDHVEVKVVENADNIYIVRPSR